MSVDIKELIEEIENELKKSGLYYALGYVANLQNALSNVSDATNIVLDRLFDRSKEIGVDMDEHRKTVFEIGAMLDRKGVEFVEELLEKTVQFFEEYEKELLQTELVEQVRKKGGNIAVEEILSVFRAMFLNGIIARLLIREIMSVHLAKRTKTSGKEGRPDYIT